MRIKLKYPDVETFIQKYAVNISRGSSPSIVAVRGVLDLSEERDSRTR